MKFKVKLNHQEEEIEAVRRGETITVTRGHQTVTLQLLHSHGVEFVLAGDKESHDLSVRQHIRAAGHADGDKRQLWVNGRTLAYERVRERHTGEPSGAAAASSLSASIPAVVSELLVREGDRVTAGDKLILLESMKMIMPIQAPYNGVVTRIHCAAGEAVQPGVQLLELEGVEESEK